MQKTHVLVIDNDYATQELLRHILGRVGYEVTLAEDGLVALETLETVTPAIILLDLMMPRMDGYTFLQEAERRGIRPQIPIIVLSAHVQGKLELSHLSINGFIIKPFHRTGLLQVIRDTIKQEPIPSP